MKKLILFAALTVLAVAAPSGAKATLLGSACATGDGSVVGMTKLDSDFQNVVACVCTTAVGSAAACPSAIWRSMTGMRSGDVLLTLGSCPSGTSDIGGAYSDRYLAVAPEGGGAGATGGSNQVTLEAKQLPDHTHDFSDNTIDWGGCCGEPAFETGGASFGVHHQDHDRTTGPVSGGGGGSSPVDIRPAYVTVHMCRQN